MEFPMSGSCLAFPSLLPGNSVHTCALGIRGWCSSPHPNLINCVCGSIVSRKQTVRKKEKSATSAFLSREWKGHDIVLVSLAQNNGHLVLTWLPGHPVFFYSWVQHSHISI